MNEQLVGDILTAAKSVAPDRVAAVPADPGAARMTRRVWLEALGGYSFPPQLWLDAVVLWAATMEGDRMLVPADLVRAALTVRDRWESVPAKARVLEQLRVERANRNYAQMGLEPIVAADLPQNAQRVAESDRGRRGGMQRLGQSLPGGR